MQVYNDGRLHSRAALGREMAEIRDIAEIEWDGTAIGPTTADPATELAAFVVSLRAFERVTLDAIPMRIDLPTTPRTTSTQRDHSEWKPAPCNFMASYCRTHQMRRERQHISKLAEPRRRDNLYQRRS